MQALQLVYRRRHMRQWAWRIEGRLGHGRLPVYPGCFDAVL